MNSSFLIENADCLFDLNGKETDIINTVNDISYIKFIQEINGGYFFNKSLLIYGFGNVPKSASFIEMNLLVNSLYTTLVPVAQYFGCDFLGNQFCFFENSVCFFNIETAEFEVVCATFEEWLDVIYNDLNYYTGQSMVVKWEAVNKRLDFNERLCPIKPFAMRGDYDIGNLYSLHMVEVINYNYDIARQIFNLPNGTKVVLKVVN